MYRRNQRALKTPMNTPQNPSESAVQISKIVISIIPTIRTFSYLFVIPGSPLIRTFSYFFVLFRVRMGDKPCVVLHRGPGVAWRIVLRCGMVWCGVVCRRRCYQKAMAGMSTHRYR